MSDSDLLAFCGHTEESEIKASDLEYNLYLQIAIAGVRGLENYSETERKWGQAHNRGHFAMLRVMLDADPDFITIKCNKNDQQLDVKVDRTKIASVGRPALERLLMQLHIYRCTGDVQACRTLFETLTNPDPKSLEWRRIVVAARPAKRISVQPNTFIVDGDVILKEYEPTTFGVIQSWAERDV